VPAARAAATHRRGGVAPLPTVVWITVAFGLAVCWAATILVNKQVLHMVTPLGVNFTVRLFSLAALAVLLAALSVAGLWPYGFGVDWPAAGWIALNAVVAWLIAFNTYYYALRGGRVGVVAPIIGTDPLWTALFAALLLGSALAPATLAGLVVAMIGVGVISRATGGDAPEGDPEVLRGAASPGAERRAADRRAAALVILLAVITAVGWGLNPVLIELGEDAHGGPSGGLIIESQLLGAIFLGVLVLVRRSPIASRRLEPGELRRVVWLLAAAGVLEALFSVGFYLCIDAIGSVLTTLIIASSPVFSMIGGVLFLRERVGRTLAIGAAVTLAGVLLATAARLL